MPTDSWGSDKPTITAHGYGFSIPVALTRVLGEGDIGDRWEGVRIETRSLSAVDVVAGVTADPDAGHGALEDALAQAREQTAPTLQAQIDDMADLLLGGA